MIFKIEVPGGTILIEIASADKPVEVSVDEDKTITITDPHDGKKVRVTVDREKKQLILDKDGFKLSVKSFNRRPPAAAATVAKHLLTTNLKHR